MVLQHRIVLERVVTVEIKINEVGRMKEEGKGYHERLVGFD